MGRIRTIKPEYWAHPIMARLPAETQLLALALLNHADDHGYFHADPAVIRGACCPFREDLATISRDLATLSQAGWIEVREHPIQGAIGFVVNWSKHQKVDHPKASKIEGYFIREAVAKSSRELREVVALDQGSGIRDQGRDQGAPAALPPPDIFDPPPTAGPTSPIAIPFWLNVGGKDATRSEDDRAGFRELVVQHPRARTIGEQLSRTLLRKIYLSELVAAVLEATGPADATTATATGVGSRPPAPPRSPIQDATAIVYRDGWEACLPRIPAWAQSRVHDEQTMLLAVENGEGVAVGLIAQSKASA